MFGNQFCKGNELPLFAKIVTTLYSDSEKGKWNKSVLINNQRTNGPVNAHLISWPSKAQNIHNLENIW